MRITKSGTSDKKTKGQRVIKMEPFMPRELLLAGKRIGETPIKRVKWLLGFAYMNLDDVSEGRRSDLAWEIKAFVLPANIAEIVASGKRKDLIVMSALVMVQTEQVSDETVRTFHDFARDGLQAAFFEGGWEFKHPAKTEKISLGLRVGEKSWPGGAGHFDIPSLKERFETNSFNLVKTEMARLGLCANPRCQKPFVTEKAGKGQFCSSRCSAYVRIARFRGKELGKE
jgi:hypothetical protein